MSRRAENWAGTAEGMIVVDMPLTGRVELQAAQCQTAADICLMPFPEILGINLGEFWIPLVSVPYYTHVHKIISMNKKIFGAYLLHQTTKVVMKINHNARTPTIECSLFPILS